MPSRFTAIWYPIAVNNVNKYLWAYWTKDKYVIVNDNGGIIKEQEEYGGRADKKNIYGEIPFLTSRFNLVINDPWIGGANDLVQANINIETMLTNMNQSHRFNSFKQPVAFGNSDDIKKIKVGPDYVVKISTQPNVDQQTDFKFVDFAIDFQNSFNAIKANIDTISQFYGVNINWEISGSPSGFSLIVKNMDLLNDWEDDIGFCRDWEKELFRLERLVYETETNKIFPQKKISVNFADVQFPIDPAEERAQWDWEIKNNFATPIDFLRTKDKDATAEELEARYEKNKEFNAQPESGLFGITE
jgi:hypothetical protein